MNAAQKEKFREALLQVADANLSRFGLGVSAFKLHVSNFGFEDVSAEDVEREVEWLTEKELLDEVPSKLSFGNRLWRLSETGRRILAAKAK